MADSVSKRKQGPGGSEGSALKKRKEGTAGRWKTPAQRAKHAERVEMGTALDVGDEGIWVTYARGMKGKAVREFKAMCDEYGEKLYGIKAPSDEAAEAVAKAGGEDEPEDIEAAIQKELEGMKAANQKPQVRGVFSPVAVGIECVFFMKTMRPVDPCQLVLQICKDAQACPSPRDRKCKYINRLTPVMDTDKATEKGIQRVARKVLASVFSLNEEEKEEEEQNSNETDEVKETAKEVEKETEQPQAEASSAVTYAIRHTMRNHTILKSEAVIKMIAGMIRPEHKVNLRTPDKVILVEIFQTFCGISIVDGKEWEALKRYNINALYDMTGEQKSGGGGKAAKASSE